MILIDATFVNSKGGVNVLKKLIFSINSSKQHHFILFLDYRLKSSLNLNVNNFEIYYLKNNLFVRQLYFFKYRKKISTIFSLGNIPLIFTGKRYQITYNMQYFIFDSSSIMNWSKQFIWIIKSHIIKSLFWISDSDVAVQTSAMKNLFINNLGFSSDKIFIYPVFTELKKNNFINFRNKFIYLSSGEEYKNIDFLLDAFIIHSKKYPKSSLVLTVSKVYKKLFNRIKKLIIQGYKINNFELVDHKTAIDLLKKNFILVHSSSVESFGLVLLEASQIGNAIIAPNLNYVHEVCIPTLTYNLNDLDGLIKCLEKSVNENLISSKPKIKNMSNDLINHLYSKLN